VERDALDRTRQSLLGRTCGGQRCRISHRYD
jgi:hypothetical protein